MLLDAAHREKLLAVFARHDERTAWRAFFCAALSGVMQAHNRATNDARPLAEVAAELADEALELERARFGAF